MSISDSVDKEQAACNVQPDPDRHCPSEVLEARTSLKVGNFLT